MDRGGRGIRRTRGGRPFIRGFYRGRRGFRRPTGSRSRVSSSRDKYESSYNDRSDRSDRSDSQENRSWDSPTGTNKDTTKEKRDGDDSSPINRNKWDKDEENSEKNYARYSDKRDYHNDSKYYRRPTGHSYRGQRRPYQNNYWDRSDRGRHYSPQSQYRTRPYRSPSRPRRYSRSPDRRRSPSRYRSRSRSLNRSKQYSSPKHRSPKRRSPSRRRSPNERSQSREKNQTIKGNSDDGNNSDDFVEKLKASKSSKTPGRVEYTQKSDDDDYWIETDNNDTKKSNRTDYSSKGSKTPGRPEISNNDKDEYWVKSQTSNSSTKNLYSSSWDDSPVREKSVPKASKTPGRKDYSTKDNDDYWINSPPNESKKDRSSNSAYSNKTNKSSSTMYVQELSSTDSEPEKITKRSRSISLTNSDKSDTPPIITEQPNKLGTHYPQTPSRGSTSILKEPPSSRGSSSILKEPPPSRGSSSILKEPPTSRGSSSILKEPPSSRGSSSILKEPPPPSIPVPSSNLPVYNSQWPVVQNAPNAYSSTTNYVQSQGPPFTAYQQGQQVPVQNAQWYQPGYQQFGAPFQQFQQYDQKPVAYNPVHSNLEPVEGYQSDKSGLYNIDLKQVVDITKPPPNITPITPVSDTQTKSSQDRDFESQRETYTTKLISLKKELGALQIQYDTFKLDNSDGRHNNELKKNRKAQDDINGKIKGVNNILVVLNSMIPKDTLKDSKPVEPNKLTTESEYVKTPTETLHEVKTVHKHRRHSTSSSSSTEIKRKRNKSNKLKKSSKVQSSDDEDTKSKKSYKSKELIDTNKKKNRVEKLPQFNYVYCDSCIHWCQPCNIFPKTAKEYLTHLHSESHKTTLEELNVVELPWHNTQTELTQPAKNPDLPNKRVPIKGLEFFIGTSAWYCKLCDIWIGDLHCASAHFKSKRHNDLYAELIAKEPNWEIEWLTKRTRAFEKSLSQTSSMKCDIIKQDNKSKENINDPKIDKSFFEKEPRKEREKEKLRDRERDRDKYKKELNRKTTELKRLSPEKESIETNNVSLSDWMKPVDLNVEKCLITLKESVQKSKDRLHKNKIDEIDEYKSSSSDVHVIKKQRQEETKSQTVYEKKDESFNLSHRNKIKLPFIGKMPFAKPVMKKQNSTTKDIPNYTVESKADDPKENIMDSLELQKMIIEKMITAANEKKIEKQALPVDMDIDDDNENNDTILSTETDLAETKINPLQQPENQIHQMYSQPHPNNTLPQDLSTALNMIFPCSEASSVPLPPTINTTINHQVHNPLIHQQHFNTPYDVTNNSSISPDRKKRKNAPSQRKRRHMKKMMDKGDSAKDECNDDISVPIIQGPRQEIRNSNGNESEGDELAMLGIDVEDMAAQYY